MARSVFKLKKDQYIRFSKIHFNDGILFAFFLYITIQINVFNNCQNYISY